MFDHNIFQDNLVGVDFCEQMVKETNPGVLDLRRADGGADAGVHGYRTIADIMRSLNPFSGAFYREALQVSRLHARDVLPHGRSPRPPVDALPGRRRHRRPRSSCSPTTYARLMKYVEFMKRVVPLHDDLFDFFYEALPGYEEVGRRRVLLGAGVRSRTPVCDFRLRDHDRVGPGDVRHAGRRRRRQARHDDLVEINLGIRILLGSSFYEDWADQRDVRHERPAGQPGRPAAPVEPDTIPKPQKRDFGDKYTWVMSPRWFDGTDHLALDTGGGPSRGSGRRRSRAGGHRLRQGHRAQRQDQPAEHGAKPEVTLRVEDPAVDATPSSATARAPTSRRTPPRRPCTSSSRRSPRCTPAAPRRGSRSRCPTSHRLRLPRGGARRALASRRDPRRQDRQLPSLSADAVERQPARHLRHARPLRRRGAEHADLRGERPDKFKGIDIMRAVRSFDPCLPCGVHMYRRRRGRPCRRRHTPSRYGHRAGSAR